MIQADILGVCHKGPINIFTAIDTIVSDLDFVKRVKMLSSPFRNPSRRVGVIASIANASHSH